MKIAKLTAGILLGVLTAYACGGKSTQAGGSNTNWFATCDSSSECGSGLTCWCGICTETCADDCSPAGATCSAPPPSCANPPKETACAVQCTKDADCKGVGGDATCVDSICRRAAVTTHRDSGAPLSCGQLTTQAQDALQPLRAGADVACQSNADCTDFTGVSCTNHCATTVISNKGLAAIQSQLDHIDQTVCTQFDAQGCMVIEPPCVFPGNPACVSGKCQHVLPGAPQPDAGTCDTQAEHIHNTLFDELDALDRSCNVDADCTRVQPELSCEYGCAVDVSTTAAAAFAAMRSGYERDLCASYNAEGCRPVITGCPSTPVEAPKCVNGVCIDDFTTTMDPAAGKSCAERTTRMTTDLQATVDVADKQCTIDADCEAVMLVNACMESCTYAPVSTHGAQSIRAELGTIETADCPWFTKAGCTVTRLPCVAPPMVKCTAGACTTQ